MKVKVPGLCQNHTKAWMSSRMIQSVFHDWQVVQIVDLIHDQLTMPFSYRFFYLQYLWVIGQGYAIGHVWRLGANYLSNRTAIILKLGAISTVAVLKPYHHQ